MTDTTSVKTQLNELSQQVDRLTKSTETEGAQAGEDLRVVVANGNAKIAEILQEAASRR